MPREPDPAGEEAVVFWASAVSALLSIRRTQEFAGAVMPHERPLANVGRLTRVQRSSCSPVMRTKVLQLACWSAYCLPRNTMQPR
jgi:hypothetical protein